MVVPGTGDTRRMTTAFTMSADHGSAAASCLRIAPIPIATVATMAIRRRANLNPSGVMRARTPASEIFGAPANTVTRSVACPRVDQ